MERAEIIRVSRMMNPALDESLCFFNPNEVLAALERSQPVVRWNRYVRESCAPESKAVALFFPCARKKPYLYGSTKSSHYSLLYKALDSFGLWDDIALHTISTPLGVVSFYDYNRMPVYDCFGLYKDFVDSFGQPWDDAAFSSALGELVRTVAVYLRRVRNHFSDFVGLFPLNDTDRRILAAAGEEAGVDIRFPISSASATCLKDFASYACLREVSASEPKLWVDKLKAAKVVRLLAEAAGNSSTLPALLEKTKLGRIDVEDAIASGVRKGLLGWKDEKVSVADKRVFSARLGDCFLSDEEARVLF